MGIAVLSGFTPLISGQLAVDQPKRMQPLRPVCKRLSENISNLLLSIDVDHVEKATFKLLPKPGETNPLGFVCVPELLAVTFQNDG